MAKQSRLGATSWLAAVLLFGCATPAPSANEASEPCINADETCRNLPSVNDCRRVASGIHNTCLKSCVLRQCEQASVRCGELVEKMCKERSERHRRAGDVTGFSQIGTCKQPREIIFWCSQEFKDPSRARECQRDAFVHELAHTCGFRHDNQPLQPEQLHDQGVPGHKGRLHDCKVQ